MKHKKVKWKCVVNLPKDKSYTIEEFVDLVNNPEKMEQEKKETTRKLSFSLQTMEEK